MKPWVVVRKGILNHLNESHLNIVTTMVDYYGMDSSNDNVWPGRREAAVRQHDEKALNIEKALFDDIAGSLGSSNPARFLPFVMMHEFEALLFSDCRKFAEALGRADLEDQIYSVRNAFASPEHINDSPRTAPSKQIERIFNKYDKILYSNLAIEKIGLGRIRDECPHFKQWIERLELINKEINIEILCSSMCSKRG